MTRLELLKSGMAPHSDSPLVPGKTRTRPRGVNAEDALDGNLIPRKVSRQSNQRRETRHHGIASTVTVWFEDTEVEASVVNVSEQGLQIEAAIAAGIGDKIELGFEGCDPLTASVIWRKGERIGLDLGQPSIHLFPKD